MANKSARSLMQGVIAGAVLFTAASQAEAACIATISNASPDQVVFNPFDGVLAFKEFDVTVVNGGSDACTLSIAAKGDATGSQRTLRNGPSSLIYLVKTDGNVELANDLNAPAGMLNIAAGTEASFRLRLEIPAGQMTGAGIYTDTLTLRLYDLAGTTPVGVDTAVSVFGIVPARAQVNIAGADTGFGNFPLDQLNFGELIEGATRNAVVQVRATAPVRVTVLSQNRGTLQHKALGTSVPSVPYTLSLAGVVGDLATGPFSVERTPRLDLSGENYPLIVTIGNLAGRVAGQYQDVLTISVVPR